jgi:hypothetical protein
VAGIFIVPAEKAQDVRWAEVRRTGVKGTTKRRNQFIRSVSQKKEKSTNTSNPEPRTEIQIMKARMNEASTLAWDSGATDAIILF